MWPPGFEDPVEHKSMFPVLKETEGWFVNRTQIEIDLLKFK